MTIRTKAFNSETSFAWQIIATLKKANNYRSMIMKCMNIMMHFYIQTISSYDSSKDMTKQNEIGIKSVHSAVPDYEIYTLYKFHKTHSGKSVRMKSGTQ